MTQQGATTQQMSDAPQGAVYVWCNSRTYYPQSLARYLGRKDIRIVARDWLSWGRLHTYNGPIVVDHAAYLTPSQQLELDYYRRRAMRSAA